MSQSFDTAALSAPMRFPALLWTDALDAVTTGIGILDTDQRIVYANPRLCQMSGLAAGEAHGLLFGELFHAEQEGANAKTDQALSLGPDKPVTGHIRRLRARNGRHYWVQIETRPITTGFADGDTTLWMVTITDVSDSTASINRMESVLEASQLGTWEWNVQTGEVIFNERWASMLGYTLAELSPLSVDTWVALVHPDDLTRANAALARHFRGESDSYQADCRLRHKNGRWVWIVTRGRVVMRTTEGNPALVYGTHQDITQNKRVMETLQDSEHSYELVALGTPSALYDWDIGSDSITWRGKSYEVLGAAGNLDLPPRSVDFQNWVHPEDWARYRRTIRRYFRRETQRLHDDLRLLRPDGSIIWVEYHGAAIWEKNRARRMFGSFTDISLHKRNDMLLRRATIEIRDIIARLGEDHPASARSALETLAAALKPPL